MIFKKNTTLVLLVSILTGLCINWQFSKFSYGDNAADKLFLLYDNSLVTNDENSVQTLYFISSSQRKLRELCYAHTQRLDLYFFWYHNPFCLEQSQSYKVSGCTKSLWHCLTSRFYTIRLLFVKDIFRSILVEQSSRRSCKADLEFWEVVVCVLYVFGGGCMIISYGLFLIRHLILRQYGYSTGLDGYFLPWLDGRMLREIAETEESKNLRKYFKLINIIIPALFFGGIYIIIIASVIQSYV